MPVFERLRIMRSASESSVKLSLVTRIPGSKVIKQFSCSTLLSVKFILLINVKMPTITGFGDLNLKFQIDIDYFNIYYQFKFHA